MRYKWKAKTTFEIMGFVEKVELIGREPKVVENADLRKALVDFFGTITEVDGNKLQYVGNAKWIGNDGSETVIGQDGYVEIDWTKFSVEEKVGMQPELEPA